MSKMCEYFHPQASCGASMNVYEYFLVLNLSLAAKLVRSLPVKSRKRGKKCVCSLFVVVVVLK